MSIHKLSQNHLRQKDILHPKIMTIKDIKEGSKL